MIIKSLTITGTGAAVQFAADGKKAKWVQALADSSNSDDILIGGAEVDSSTGFPLAKGASQFMPQVSDLFEFYQFGKMYAYIANNDVLHVLYGVEGSN